MAVNPNILKVFTVLQVYIAERKCVSFFLSDPVHHCWISQSEAPAKLLKASIPEHNFDTVVIEQK